MSACNLFRSCPSGVAQPAPLTTFPQTADCMQPWCIQPQPQLGPPSAGCGCMHNKGEFYSHGLVLMPLPALFFGCLCCVLLGSLLPGSESWQDGQDGAGDCAAAESYATGVHRDATPQHDSLSRPLPVEAQNGSNTRCWRKDNRTRVCL